MHTKKGFTLAEVLITIGIIGVVAAMTIPTLIGHIENIKNTSLLREDYAILSQMMKMAADTGSLNKLKGQENMAEMKKWFDNVILPNIKTSNVCYNEPGCWHGKTKTLNGKNGCGSQSTSGCGHYTVSFILNNGTVICMDDQPPYKMRSDFGYDPGNTLDWSLVFYIDVNGGKQPNVFGKDTFALIYDVNNDAMTTPGATLSEEEVARDCSKTGTGRFCSTYAKRNGWTLPKL